MQLGERQRRAMTRREMEQERRPLVSSRGKRGIFLRLPDYHQHGGALQPSHLATIVDVHRVYMNGLPFPSEHG